MPKSHQPSLRHWTLIACVFIATPSLAQTSVVEKHGRLSVEENRIVDQKGGAVVLRGMSLYWSQWKGDFYNRNAVKWLRDDWNCSVDRAAMAVDMGGYLKNPEAEKAKVKAAVEAAIDLGIYGNRPIKKYQRTHSSLKNASDTNRYVRNAKCRSESWIFLSLAFFELL